ncbi:phage major capsid protein [Desulfuromonas sp. TF]|uniref:phage major capsid protein n=1 Tax=Desulfuromonas sp. TF TaxID=1232410 RepID=UPI000428BBAC|nr:phage major capsid protein [Desulfuromonas sp. TF]
MPANSPRLKTGKLFRSLSLNREAVDLEGRTVEFSFSSEAPVERWFGVEILDHGPKAVRWDRVRAGGPFLMDHRASDQRGVIEKVWIDNRTGRTVVRLSRSDRGEELLQDIADGIRPNISVGYLIHEMILEKEENGLCTYRATDWEPYEISSVSMPADITVGVGRSEDTSFDHETVIFSTREEEERKMKCKHCQRELQDGQACTCPEARAATGNGDPSGGDRRIEVNREEVVAGERKRIAAIETIAGQFRKVPGIGDLARQFRENGKSVEEFRGAVLARLAPTETADVPDPVRLSLNEGEDRQFSLQRAIHYAAFGGDGGFERELSDEIGKKLGRETEGIFVPTSIRVGVRAPMTAGDAGQGAELVTVGGGAMTLIEYLYARSLVKQLGATVLDNLVGEVPLPRQLKTAALNWTGENPGADAADTDATGMWGKTTLRPRQAIATVPFSKQLIAQTSLAIENHVRQMLGKVNAGGLDKAAINGPGGNEPLGILNTTGIGAVVIGADGGALSWPVVVGLETEVEIDNADFGKLAYLTAPQVKGRAKELEKFSGSGQPIWPDKAMKDGIGELNGYRAGVSTNVPTDLSKGGSNGILAAMIFGNWEELYIGEWGVLEILADPYALKKQGMIEITSTLLADTALGHPQGFASCEEINPAL